MHPVDITAYYTTLARLLLAAVFFRIDETAEHSRHAGDSFLKGFSIDSRGKADSSGQNTTNPDHRLRIA